MPRNTPLQSFTPIRPLPPPDSPPGNDSQYSSDYNDEWDNFMNNRDNRNVTRRRTQNQSSSLADDDDFIQGRELLLDDLNGPDSEEEDGNESSDLPQVDETKVKPWGNKEMPPIPAYPEQIIDINAEGFDPFTMDNQKIIDYIKENRKENIVILYNGKYYLSSRAIIEQQEDEALVYECIEGGWKPRDGKTEYENIIGNLPLYNIKKIGINISSDNAVGIEPEYIYMDGIDKMLSSPDDYQWPFYSIIALPDKMLVSVISKAEALKMGSAFTGVSALHCQAGQGGLAGILVNASPNESFLGGRKGRKTRTAKKRTAKKRSAKKRSSKKRTAKKINKRKSKKKTKK